MFMTQFNETELLLRLDYLETKTMKRKATDELFTLEPERKKWCLEQESNSDAQKKLKAYKRIWETLDINNPLDAQLEPFLWHKIRTLSSSASTSLSNLS